MESSVRTIKMVTSTTPSSQDHLEDIPADIDEPPEPPFAKNTFSPPKSTPNSAYTKAMPPYMRRESLLTRQLHSETEHSDEEQVFVPTRGLSTASTWSNPSIASTADLTSDDGRSVASPAISPPLPPTSIRNALPIIDKPLNSAEPKILGLDTVAKDTVEAGLGRKRCITFACGNKEKPVAVKPKVEQPAASPPKRKCSLRFVCPNKPDQPTLLAAPVIPTSKRFASPAPRHRRSSSSSKTPKSGRSSEAVSPASPRLLRKSPASDKSLSSTLATPKRTAIKPLDYSDDSGAEATRFHEFASSEDEPDEWTQESTCYRNRLCVSDTLKKENVIRQLAEEVAEEEAIEEEEDEEIDQEEDDDDNLDDQDTINTIDDEEEDDESDAGFHSDDEQGFAVSDSDDGEGSDNEWWTPGGASTAATSAEHLDHSTKITPRSEMVYASSQASNSSANDVSPHSRSRRPRALRSHPKTSAMPIERPTTPDLPDSTDFVCGTLDEDRPKEQAYINCMKEREAAKHPLLPQDIDPTFPTSDPEMDEEDDEDLDDAASSDGEAIMHGSLDSIHGTARRISPAPRRESIKKRSPVRHRSPAPLALRAKSPAPKARLGRSPSPPPPPPPPPTTRHRSPAPLAAVRTKSPVPKPRPARSPAPANVRARSPASRKLFGHSPRRMHSPPAHGARTTSPPNTRRASPSTMMPSPHRGLAGRPNTLAITASLPKRPGGFLLSRLGMHTSDVDSSDTVGPESHAHRGGRRRGAIDIVKGLEKKKQRRHEKHCQKLAAKAAARGEERKKIKPGRGLERMREVGLELQKYKGGTGHILSY